MAGNILIAQGYCWCSNPDGDFHSIGVKAPAQKPDRYIWQPGETPIFTKLLHEYQMGVDQNMRLWNAWDILMWKKYNDNSL